MHKRDSLKFLTQIHIFQAYTFALEIFYGALNFAPSIIRIFFFKIIFQKIGPNCLIDYKTYFRFPNKISIGKGVTINRGCEFFGTMLNGGAKIVIGDYVTFSPGVKLYSAAQNYMTLDLNDKVGDIFIEDFAWIGAGVIVLPGIKIGKGAVVGAGSVVTKSIPCNTVAVGVPAKVIKSRGITKFP
jgi:maltose O-acetyltransferase